MVETNNEKIKETVKKVVPTNQNEAKKKGVWFKEKNVLKEVDISETVN